MKVAIIAALNEEETIGTVVIKTKRHVDTVIVVDDGSKDKTAEVGRLAGAEVISHIENRGKGEALKTGFERADELAADIVVTIDADFQHNPDDIPTVISPILEGEADMVIGSRFLNKAHKKDIPLYRRLGQWILTTTTNLDSDIKITDSQSGFRAFSKDILRNFKFTQKGLSIESEMLDDAIEHGIKIKEVPISMRYEGLETSTETPRKHGMGVLNFILKIVMEKRPLLFFGVSGMILLIAGLAFGLYSLNSYFANNQVPFGPSLAAAVLILIGVLSVFAGMILNSIVIMIRSQTKMDQHRGEMLLKNISEQINQKPVHMDLSRAEMLLGDIDKKLTPGLTSFGNHQGAMPFGAINGLSIPGMTTMGNPHGAILHTNINGNNLLGLTSLDSIESDPSIEVNDADEISEPTALTSQGGGAEGADEQIIPVPVLNNYPIRMLHNSFRGKKYRI